MFIKTSNQSNLTLPILLLILSLFTQGCAHQSKVKPSKGHIDGQNQANTAKSFTQSDMAIPRPIKNIPHLPPPQAKVKPQTYSVVVNEVPVKEILFALARESKINIDIHPSIQGVVTINAVDQTLPAILERLSRQVDLTYKMEAGTLSIRPDSPYLKTYAVNYVNMNRDTTGEISVSNQIASNANITSDAKKTENAGAVDNTSKTKVVSKSENHFWDSLIQNIKDILQESDKEVLIKRLVTDYALRDSYRMSDSVRTLGADYTSGIGMAGLNVRGAEGAFGSENEAQQASKLSNRQARNDSNATEYRKLYAASVIANKETGVLSIRATQKQHEKVQEFLDKVQASSKRQVLIEASIVEIRLNDRYQAGIDWEKLGNGFTFSQNSSFTTPESVASKLPSLVIGYNANKALGSLSASVKLLQTFGTTKVLSSPKLMVLNSQTAILKAVENLVYFTIVGTIQASTGPGIPAITTFTTTPRTIPIGIWMSVTPQINENNMVTMNVRPTISRQSGEIQDPNPSLKISKDGLTENIRSVIPQITVREMESMLQVPSGNTVILGGLMQDEIYNNSNGVPGLSKVPVFGNAFKARDESTTKTELIIFLRATVIPNASLDSEELQTYKQYLPSQQLQNALDESSK